MINDYKRINLRRKSTFKIFDTDHFSSGYGYYNIILNCVYHSIT